MPAGIRSGTLRSPPDVWFDEHPIFEVQAANVTLSAEHGAAGAHVSAAGVELGEHHNGLALRFPRFLRRRADKGVEGATTSQELAAVYARTQPASE